MDGRTDGQMDGQDVQIPPVFYRTLSLSVPSGEEEENEKENETKKKKRKKREGEEGEEGENKKWWGVLRGKRAQYLRGIEAHNERR